MLLHFPSSLLGCGHGHDTENLDEIVSWSDKIALRFLLHVVFLLRQELKKSQSSFVRPMKVCLELSLLEQSGSVCCPSQVFKLSYYNSSYRRTVGA